MLTQKEFEQLFLLLDKLVNDTTKPWMEKRTALEDAASTDDLTNVREFAAWWEST